MTAKEFSVLNNIYNASAGRAQSTMDLGLSRALSDRDIFARLAEQGFTDAATGEITEKGLSALEPYRVRSAVILAAGSATRFIPLSLEQPKALYEVRGEKLIDRQIKQLKEAGIEDITVVVGYKKDMFRYLGDKYGVRLLFNPAYNVKNNIESLCVAREHISDSYICVCDSYFVENPFNSFEYRPFYAGYSSAEVQDEFHMQTDGEGRIVKIDKCTAPGLVLLGHSFWNREFSSAFFALADADRKTGAYDGLFWEWLVKDRLGSLPAFYFKEYAPGDIQEFDYFEQLRQFDTGYVSHAKSDIIRNIKLVFRCDEEDVVDFRTVKEGLTNTSFIFQIDGVDYIYRHPGDGTELIINRRNERTSLEHARDLGLDPTYIEMNVEEGWKISRFVPAFREPDYASFEDAKIVIEMMRRLHASDVTLDYGLQPWEDAGDIELLLKAKDPGCFEPYEDLKRRIGELYSRTKGDGVRKCFCHGDTYCHNWMMLPEGQVILIDWEYAGFSDPGIDVGYYIVDAMYDVDLAKAFIREYLRDTWSPELEKHYLYYTAIIAYYWFVWALYRESCGAVMGESLENWRCAAERFSAE